MRAAIALAVLAAVTASGCYGCPYEASSLEGRASMPADYSEQNRTAWRQALEGAGFAVESPSSGSITAKRGADTVHVFLSYNHDQPHESHVQMDLDIEDREFPDSPAGYGRAREYTDAEAARLYPQANATFQLLLAAVGLPGQPLPPLEGSISIC